MKIEPQLLLVWCAVAAAGCSDAVEPTSFGAPQIVTLTQAESAAVLSTIDSSQVQLSQLARPRLVNTGAQSFADAEIVEHGQLDAELQALLQQQGLVPLASAVSAAIANDAAQWQAMVVSAPVGNADWTYVNAQLSTHRQAIIMVDCAIMPGLTNAALGIFVQNTVRPALQQHFDRAVDVASQLAQVPADDGSTGQVGSGLTVAPTTVSCAAACDPSTVTGFSLDLRDALCL